MELVHGMALTRTDPPLSSAGASNEVASIRLRDLSLSRRTLNALTNAGLVTVGDLLHLSAAEVIRIPNLGSKSHSEIERSLRPLQVTLSPVRGPAPSTAQRCAHSSSDAEYSLRLMEIPGAALRRLEAAGVDCACQLETVNHAELLRAMDFNTVLAGAVAAELRKRSEGRLRRRYDGHTSARPSDAPTLDAELWSLTAPLVDGDSRHIAMAVYGWDGSARRSLPEIAESFGVDGGTVGSICARVEARWKTETVRLPLLSSALSLLASRVPVLASDFEEQLVRQGLTGRTLRTEGLLSAAAIAGLEAPFALLGNQTRLIIPRGREADFNAVVQVIRRAEKSHTSLSPQEISIVASQAAGRPIPVEFVRRSVEVVHLLGERRSAMP